MFALKVAALLGFVVLATSIDIPTTDVGKGLAIMACCKRIITNGVPELHIPPHKPLLHFVHNSTFTKKVAGADVTLDLINMTWEGITSWELVADQLTKDSDSSANFTFRFHWDWMQINGSYGIVAPLVPTINGTFSLDFQDTEWVGNSSFLKPTEESYGLVNDLKMDWHVKDFTVYLTGLGIANRPAGAAVANYISTTLNTNGLDNGVGKLVRQKFEDLWWNTGVIWTLVDWCAAHPEETS